MYLKSAIFPLNFQCMLNGVVFSLGPIENIPCSFDKMTVLFAAFVQMVGYMSDSCKTFFFPDILKYWLN